MKFIVLIVGVFSFTRVAGQQHQNGNMYLFYNVSNNNYYNIDQEITPQTIAPGTFWALTFGFNELSNGGYIGIQTDYSDTKKGMFIFSIWNAIDAVKGDKESFTVDFGGEGIGKSCRISIPLIELHTYMLRIWQLEKNSSGTYFGAWIIDKSIDKEYFLGKIKTNKRSTLSNRVSNFVEYYGDKKPCNKVPYTQAIFHSIKFNCNDEVGQCQSVYLPFKYSYGDCVNGNCVLNINNTSVSFGGK